MSKEYDVKMEIKGVTIHDLSKIISAFIDQDYWTPNQTMEIKTKEYIE